MPPVIQIENLSKMYRLGEVGSGTLRDDLARAWATLRGKEDPFARVGHINNREKAGGEYVWALRDVTLEVEEGQILGVIGRNGAGKSTLLKLLSRVTAPTTGCIRTRGRIASLLEVGTGFHPDLTGRENVFMNGALLGMTRREISNRLEEIIEFSGCAKYIDTPVKRYSSGMTVRLGFAVAAHLECEILIVDEVLAVGDAEFQNKCMGKMKDVASSGRTVIFVSHSLASIRSLCTSAILVERGAVTASGDVADIISRYIPSSITECMYTKVWNGAASRPTITHICLHTADETPTGEFPHNESISVTVSVLFPHFGQRTYFALHVHKSDQETLLFCRDFEANPALLEPRPSGSQAYRITLPANILAPGQYSISLHHVSLSPPEPIELLDHVCGFKVFDNGSLGARMGFSSFGHLSLKPTWTRRQMGDGPLFQS